MGSQGRFRRNVGVEVKKSTGIGGLWEGVKGYRYRRNMCGGYKRKSRAVRRKHQWEAPEVIISKETLHLQIVEKSEIAFLVN